MLVSMLLFGALIPGAAAGLVALLAGRRGGDPMAGQQPGAAAVGLGFAVAFAASFGVGDLLHPQSWHWIFWGGAAGGAAFLLRGRAVAPPALALITAVAGALLLRPMLSKLVPHELGPDQVLVWTAGLAAVIGAAAAALEIAARSFPARALAPAWAAYAAGFAGLMFELGSARLGQFGGFLAAGCGALALLAWWRPSSIRLGAAGVPLALVLGLTGANAGFFGYDVAWQPLALAALPPFLLAGAARWTWLRGLKPLPAAVVLSAAALAPMVAALLWSLAGAEVDPYGASELPY